MENRAHALAAGLFILLLTAGVLATAVWFSGEAVQSENYQLVSRYPVTGLNLQAPVRYRGVQVGKVVGIDFGPAGSRAILVEISVRSGTPLTKGTFAQLGSQGVTGLSYVILDDDGSNAEPLVAENDNLARIDVRSSFMDSITGSGQELVATAGNVAKRLDVLLNENNQAQLLRTLSNLEQAAGKAVALANAIEPTAKALPAVINDAGIALKRADALLANLNQRVETFERAAKGVEQLGASGAALSDAVMADSLPRLNLLIDDLQRSSRSLDRLLDEISEQPASLVFGRNPVPPGPGEPGFGPQRGGR